MGSEYVSDVTDNTFDTEVLQSQLPVLVDFWASWCAPCKAIAPAIDRIAQAQADKLKVVKLDVQANMRTASQFGVTNIPTFLVVKGGQVVGKQVGTAGGENGLKSLISSHI